MIDCLIVGPNITPFEEVVSTIRSMGEDWGGFREVDLALVEHEGKPYHGLGAVNHFRSTVHGHHDAAFDNSDFVWPVVLVLGSFLAGRGHSFDHINLFQQEKDAFRRKLMRNDIRTIAITTTMYVSVEPILDVVHFIRKHNRTARIVVGGPYIMNQTQMLDREALHSLFNFIGADIYIVSAEGELALSNTLDALKDGRDLSAVDNLAYRENGGFVETMRSRELNPLEDNMVDYTLFPAEDFGQFLALRTAKSCPFKCDFCAFPSRAGKYTYLDVDHVEQTLNAIRDLGTINTLTFIDDTFNVPKKRFKDIMRMMIRNRYGFKWNSYLRCDHADEECIALMKESGCEGVFLGIESGSVSMLKRMNKKVRPEDFLRVVPMLREADILSHGNIIVGFPGETYQTVQESVDLLEAAQPDFYKAQLWYCDPTTPIYQRREEFGIRGTSFKWSHNTMDTATAADLVDKLFLSVNNPIWLPQFGFEMWSLYYLQRHGFAKDRIKMYMQCFNTAVKQKLLNPWRRECHGAVLDSLVAACRFESPEPPDLRPVEAGSGAAYSAAERYCIDKFRPEDSAAESLSGNLSHVREQWQERHTDQARWRRIECRIEGAVVGNVTGLDSCDPAHVAIAAFGTLLARWTGIPEMAMLVACHEDEATHALPIRVAVPWHDTLGKLAVQIRESLAQAWEHRLFALHILTNPLRLKEHGLRCPEFEAGCVIGASTITQRTEPGIGLVEYPGIVNGLDLVLEVGPWGEWLPLTLWWRDHAFNEATMNELGDYLTTIFRDSYRALDGSAESDADAPTPNGGSSNHEDFNFA